MYRLHIYNPEHDIALGKDTDMFTPPKAARLMREAFGHIPAYWAEDSDWILVDDVQHAEEMLDKEQRRHADVRFVDAKDLSRLTADGLPSAILPWGWDKYLVKRLLSANSLFKGLVPDAEQLDVIRRLSSREFVATSLLPELVSADDRLVGRMSMARSMDELMCEMNSYAGDVVLKSPWSCSGRGVRFISGNMTESVMGWCRNILAEQGLLMIEPLYDKVCDFAMEFMADERNGTQFLGLNVFETHNGAYINNVMESKESKLQGLTEHVAQSLLEKVRDNIVSMTSELFRDKYSGPFGVDMMIIKDHTEMKVHPCVELNLRRTMGHIVL